MFLSSDSSCFFHVSSYNILFPHRKKTTQRITQLSSFADKVGWKVFGLNFFPLQKWFCFWEKFSFHQEKVLELISKLRTPRISPTSLFFGVFVSEQIEKLEIVLHFLVFFYIFLDKKFYFNFFSLVLIKNCEYCREGRTKLLQNRRFRSKLEIKPFLSSGNKLTLNGKVLL